MARLLSLISLLVFVSSCGSKNDSEKHLSQETSGDYYSQFQTSSPQALCSISAKPDWVEVKVIRSVMSNLDLTLQMYSNGKFLLTSPRADLTLIQISGTWNVNDTGLLIGEFGQATPLTFQNQSGILLRMNPHPDLPPEFHNFEGKLLEAKLRVPCTNMDNGTTTPPAPAPQTPIDPNAILNESHCPQLQINFPQGYEGQRVWVNAKCETVFFKPTINKNLIMTLPSLGAADECSGNLGRDLGQNVATLQLVDYLTFNHNMKAAFQEANPQFKSGPVKIDVKPAPFQASSKPSFDKNLVSSYWEMGPIANLTLTLRGACLMVDDRTKVRSFEFNEIKLSRLLQQNFFLNVTGDDGQITKLTETWSLFINVR